MSLKRTVILADDHTLLRAGIRSLLDDLSHLDVVAETGDGSEALQLVRHQQPDVIVLDITLPGLNGLEVAKRIRKLDVHTRILMLSMHAGPEYVARAWAAGAHGYVVKDAAFDELAQAIDTVLARQRYLSDGIDPEVVARFESEADNAVNDLSALTPRQRQILQLIAEGNSTREIAEHLSLSIKTIDSHRAQLMDRVGIHDVPGLVRFAIRTGLITPES